MTNLEDMRICPRTERPRTDPGCLHCMWSAKLASLWLCMRPWEADDRERGTCTVADGRCSGCGFQTSLWDYYNCCPRCGRTKEGTP